LNFYQRFLKIIGEFESLKKMIKKRGMLFACALLIFTFLMLNPEQIPNSTRAANPSDSVAVSNPPLIELDSHLLKFLSFPLAPFPKPQFIKIRNAGGGALKWTISKDKSWLTVSPSSGVNKGEIQASVNPSSLRSGVYLGMIKVQSKTAANSPQTIKIILEIRDKTFYAGFRSSRYGISPFPESEYWARVGREMAGRFKKALPGGVWIVGIALDDGGCLLNFPSPGKAYTSIQFLDVDQNEEYLSYFDSHQISVWLQVEPGDANVSTLIDLVLNRYQRHPCVKGFGVDVEWFRWKSNQWGKTVADSEASYWSKKVWSHKPSYSLFLKHWLPSKMPPAFRNGLFFIDDSQEFPSLDEMVEEFKVWGAYFWPNPVGFQFGYEADKPWWEKLSDPPSAIGSALKQSIPNTYGLFWVDFTLEIVFPPLFFQAIAHDFIDTRER
jgi:hypothetical protein